VLVVARAAKASTKEALHGELVSELIESMGMSDSYADAVAIVLVPVVEDFMMRVMMSVVEARKGKK
jgi:hypothetical protein